MNKQFQSNLTDNDDIKLDQEVREVLYGLRENLFKLVYNKKEDVHYLEYKDSATLKDELIFFHALSGLYTSDGNLFILSTFEEFISRIHDDYCDGVFERLNPICTLDLLYFDNDEILMKEFHYDAWLNKSYEFIYGDLFDEIENYFPPYGCPSLKRIKNYNGSIIDKIYYYIDKYKDNDNWTAGKNINVCKWLALKYTFKNEFLSYKKLYNNLKTNKHYHS